MRFPRIAVMAIGLALAAGPILAGSADAATAPSASVATAVLPSPTVVFGPTESLSPDTAPAGTAIFASGTGFPADTANCALFLQKTEIATCAVAADGSWRGSFTVPEVPAEIVAVIACAGCQATTTNLALVAVPRPHAQANLTIVPKLRTDHSHAAAGSTVLAHGDGFRGAVSFSWSDPSATVTHAVADPAGEVDATLTVPSAAQFPITLRACDDSIDRAAFTGAQLLDQCASTVVSLLVPVTASSPAAAASSAAAVVATGGTSPTPPTKRASFDAQSFRAAGLGILAVVVALLALLTFRRRLRRRARPDSRLQIRCVAGDTAISLRVQLLDRDGLRILMERDTPGVFIRGITP